MLVIIYTAEHDRNLTRILGALFRGLYIYIIDMFVRAMHCGISITHSIFGLGDDMDSKTSLKAQPSIILITLNSIILITLKPRPLPC